MKGYLLNTITVFLGSLCGLYIGKKINEATKTSVFNALGLITIFIGTKMALMGKDIIVIVLSVVLGALTGALIRLEENVGKAVDRLKVRYFPEDSNSQGFIIATTLFCVGSMTIIGSLKDGLYNDATLIQTKSVMDGFASIILTAKYGISVAFSAISVFIIQGTLTILSKYLPLLSERFLYNLDGVGGILILSIGLNLLNITFIKTLDLLPSLIILPLLLWLF